MPSRRDSTASIPLSPSNAFSPVFLQRLDERDEPPTGVEADTAGPWSVEPVPGRGFGLFRLGERPSRGFRPAAIFPGRRGAPRRVGVEQGAAGRAGGGEVASAIARSR